MESDLGKLFVGGISWDTNEDRLREYFSSYGEVTEAVIMKDRTTGRARGFGFIVFADPAVAERVILEKHLIDGRMVEAKKAVPRDDQSMNSRNTNTLHGSPGPGRTKKIFVGGLASTVTESDFKNYFDQFGTITDVVVMYDHNTQRPRGFGFITFDSEDAVDKVLVKTFHELNGKLVEVKKAVPKELSPGPSMRSLVGGYNYGSLNRASNFLNGYNPSNSIGSYGMRIDSRFSPIASGRNVFHSFTPGYGVDMNFEPGVSLNYGGNTSFSNGVGYGRARNPYYSGNSNRYTASPVGYNSGNNTTTSVLNSVARNVWGNGSLNYTSNFSRSNSFLPSGSANFGGFSNNSLNWGDNNFGLGMSSYDRNTRGSPSINTSFSTAGNGYEGNLADTYNNNPIYSDVNWQLQSSELDGSGPFGYGLGSASSDVTVKASSGLIGDYNVANRQPNRGVTKETIIVTPLMDFIRQKRAAKSGAQPVPSPDKGGGLC